ncbi:MAG TPA: hypothetical protein VG500_16395 [Gemmatimonadales bacterium]|jgi:hypothetical protein|nr:hypothetical protein [Gemmatimonadales bacterium]
MVPTTLRPLSVGEILDVSFTLYRRHFATLGTVAVLCSGLPVLLSLYIEASGGVLQNLQLTLLYYVVFTVLSSIATAATVFVVSESYLGRPLSARGALQRATPMLGRLIVCSLLLAIVVGFGFLLFMIPGIVLLSGLLLAFPSLVLEAGNSPTGALSRSWSLTRGSRWRMLGLLVTLVILLYVPIVALGAIATVAFPADGILTLAVVGVMQMLLYPLLYCVLTVAYYDLRVRKEGFDLEVLASTLQPA